MGQQFRLKEMPIGACDHMDHAFAPYGVHRGAKHFRQIRRLSELPVDGSNLARTKRLYHSLSSCDGVQLFLRLLDMPVHSALAETKDGSDFPAGLSLRRPCEYIAFSFA